jgi:hypothetical protein
MIDGMPKFHCTNITRVHWEEIAQANARIHSRLRASRDMLLAAAKDAERRITHEACLKILRAAIAAAEERET